MDWSSTVTQPSEVILSTATMTGVDLSIIIVNWNTRELLRECLNSVEHTIDDLEYEVIVADNGSSDGSVEMVSQAFPHAILLRNTENRGFAAANNQGIAISRGRHILLLNSDAQLLPRTASQLVGYLDSHPHVGIVGPQVLNGDHTYQGSYASFPTFTGEVLLLTGLARFVYPPTYPSPGPEDCRYEKSVDWVSGACLLARRAAVEAVGELDEEYFMYSEETDWCYRMKQAGWDVAFLPSARALHKSGSSSMRVPERRRTQIYRSKWLFMLKHQGRLKAMCFRALVRAVTAVKFGLCMWMTFVPDAKRRGLARGNLTSHRYLLANF